MRIRFWVAFRAAAWTMGIYTAIMLLIIGERLGGDSASAGGHLLAGTLTTLFFAILAGSVGGVVGILFGYRPKKEEKHEPAS